MFLKASSAAIISLASMVPSVVLADSHDDSPPSTDSINQVSVIDEIVVTGTRSGANSRLLPMTVSVVNEDRLTERGEPNILPTLTQDVPGMFVTQRGVLGYSVSTGGSGGIKMRGIGGSPNTDVLVLIDGLPQYAGLYGHPVADNYQTMLAERVEVVRGPASMYYGSNAMGGVVNIITHQLEKDTVITNVHAQGGSYKTFDAGVSNQFRKRKFSSAAGYNYCRTDGHRPNMEFQEHNGFLRLGYDFSEHWRLGGSGNIAYFSTHNPGTVSAPIEESQFDILRGMAAVSLENKYSQSRFPTSGAVRFYYNGGKHEINDGHAHGAPAPTQVYNHTDLMTGMSAYQVLKFFKGNRTTFGFDYQYFGGHAWNSLIANGNETDIIDKKQSEVAGYVDFHQRIASWLALDAGIRLGNHSEAGFNYAPQGGLSFILCRDAEIKALVSRGYRNPTIRELYMYKPANKELNPVSLWNYELSYRHFLIQRRMRLGINVFYLHSDDNIETQMVNGRPLNVNTGELKNTGFEAEVNYRIWRGLHVGTNYSFLHMENPTLAAPEHKFNLSVGYHHDRFRVGSSLQCISGLYTALATKDTPAVTESFVLWNANASVRIWRELWANVKADNLLGQEYEINAGFPMPKTTVMAGFNWTF